MKKLFKKLKDVDVQLSDVKRMIEEAPSLEYYKKIAPAGQLEKDLEEYKEALHILLDYKIELLDKLEDAVGVEIRELKKLCHAKAA